MYGPCASCKLFSGICRSKQALARSDVQVLPRQLLFCQSWIRFVDQQLALPDSYMASTQAQPFLAAELEALRTLLRTYGEK